MKISIIVVNYCGDRFIRFLLKNMKNTMKYFDDSEIIVVDNNNDPDNINAKHEYGRDITDLGDGTELEKYDNVKLVNHNEHAFPTGIHHGLALQEGYRHIRDDSDIVFVMDQDLIFLKRHWDVDVFGSINEDCVLSGVIGWWPNSNNLRFTTGFLKAIFLAFSRSEFDVLIKDHWGFIPYWHENDKKYSLPSSLESYKTESGDTCCKLSWYCDTVLKKNKVLFLNSDNFEVPQLFTNDGRAFTAWIDDVPFLHHIGTSHLNVTPKIEKILDRGFVLESEISEVYRNAFVHHRKDL
tara:strand:+ start:2894 stop:3778 length:885 start_codon:yes stop_codon:yes gene_type:complete